MPWARGEAGKDGGMSEEADGAGAALDAGLPVSLEDMRAWLRLSGEAEDLLLIRLIAVAAQICEAFIGQWVMVRGAAWRGVFAEYSRTLVVPGRPVVAVDGVALVADGEADLDLPPHEFHIVTDRDGGVQLRVDGRYGRRAARVDYRAGMAADPAEVPEGLRHGMIRMVQHLYETRDVPSLGGMPPASVVALWQPWRRMTLGAAPRFAGAQR